jgi:hypothetical protein
VIIQNRFTEWLAERLVKFARRKTQFPPNFVVGQDGNPYMKRWWILFTPPSAPEGQGSKLSRLCARLFNVYIHEFVHDDDDRALHDHPAPSISISLGEIGKEYYRWSTMDEIYLDRDEIERERTVEFGSIVFRSAKFAHRMIVPNPGHVTIFIFGPRVREWGFVCPAGWRHWKEFTAPGNSGTVGRGCGE